MHVTASVATVWCDPATVRPIDEPAVRVEPDLAAWTAALGTPERLDLHGRVETQALRGEPVLVDAVERDWAKVVLPRQSSRLDSRGYPGWIPLVQLGSGPVADGTEFLFPPGVEPGGADVLDTATRFLGVNYLWGGRCGFGVDCSGLVGLAYQWHGITIPRDAHDQALVGEPVELNSLRRGDLLFFAKEQCVHHVALALGDGDAMLHAPGAGACVRYGRASEFAGETCTARRVFSC